MDHIKEVVRDRYGAAARSGDYEPGAMQVAEAFGYSMAELASVPAEANMGLSCGNPTVIAGLRPGEVVLDLGCGGGLDVFLAGQKVGPAGKAIGVDMTADMIDRATRNAEKAELTNVEFHLAEIEALPLHDQSVDCVISNCVLNLVPDKDRAFTEIFRVLKLGGRLAVTDIALIDDLPAELRDDLTAYIACIAGAIRVEEYAAKLKSAGFEAVHVLNSGTDLNSYAKLENQVSCCSPAMGEQSELAIVSEACCDTKPSLSVSEMHQQLADLLRKYNANDYAASVKVFAIKPSDG